MSDLFLAFSIFSGINIFKNKQSESEMKYILCYFPLVGAVIGAILCLWYILAARMGLGIICGIVSPVIIALITGNRHFGVLSERFDRIGAAVIYTVFLIFVFMSYTIHEVLIASGVFVLARIMAIFLFFDNDFIEDGLYKTLADKSRKAVVSVITVVWLMAAVAFIEMLSIPCFIVTLITVIAVYFIFSTVIKRRKYLNDHNINWFIVICEGIIFLEIVIGRYMSLMVNPLS